VLPRDDRRAVHVFTNCGEVVLSINGREAFVLRGRRYAMCSIPFEQADLVAEGRKGDAVARWILPAHGAARALSIRPEADRCAAVAGRVVGFCVVVVDAAGRDVPCWRGEVKATVDAPGRLRSPYGDGVVPVAGGKGRAFVCATGQSGRARLRAETSGLEPGGAVIEFVEGDGGVTVGRST
jgi:hypothetical protein